MDVNKFGVTWSILGSLNMARILFTLFGLLRANQCSVLGGCWLSFLRQWDFAAEVKFLGSHFEFHGIEFCRHAVFPTAHFIIGLR